MVEAQQRRRWANIGYTTTKGMITRSRAAPWVRAASGTSPHRLFVFIEVADPSRSRGKLRTFYTPKLIIMHWMKQLVLSSVTCSGHSLDTLQVYWWLTLTDERSCRVGPRSVSMFRPWEQSGREQQPSIFPNHLFDSTATRQPRSCCAFGSMRGDRVRSGRLVSTWYAIKLLECSIMWHVQKQKKKERHESSQQEPSRSAKSLVPFRDGHDGYQDGLLSNGVQQERMTEYFTRKSVRLVALARDRVQVTRAWPLYT